MIGWLGPAAHGFLIWGAWWLAGSGLRQTRWLDCALAACVLGLSWCVLGLEILGTAGLLHVGPLLLWSGALFSAGLFVVRRGLRRSTPPLAGGAASESWRAETILCLSLVLWVCLELGMQSLLWPVKVVSDGPIYHLYFAARWWKVGRLILVAAPFGENGATYFPANGDLWFTWLMTTWGGDRLAKVGQAPFLLMAAAAAAGLARTVGASRNSSAVAACWFVTSTSFLIFSFEANVDTIFIACYLTAAHFLLRYAMAGAGPAALILGGLATGLALGTKPVGVVLVPPLLVLAAVVIATRTQSVRATLAYFTAVLACTFLTSGFWFLRNFRLTGNPLYPLHLELFGLPVLHGWYGPQAMRSSIYYLPVRDWRSLLDTLMAVADPRLAPFWLLAIGGAWAVGSKQSPAIDRWTWRLSALAVLNIAFYWLCIPYRTQQRFMLQSLGLAAAPLARLLDCARGLRLAAAGLLALHILTPQDWPVSMRSDAIPWDLSPMIPNAIDAPLSLFEWLSRVLQPGHTAAATARLAVLICMGCCAVLAVWGACRSKATRRGTRQSWILATVAALVLLLLGVLDTSALQVDRRALFYPLFPDFYAGWQRLESLSGPSGTRVAYAGTNIPYYLFGAGLRNEVCYVNIDAHRDWLLHDYHRAAAAQGEPTWPNSRPGWDRAHPDFRGWLGNLQAERIGFLVVTRVNPGEGAHNVADAEGFPVERRWAESHRELFEPVYGQAEHDRFFRLYRFRGPSSTSLR
ncbi:MAG: glycosyltransferase family 39 protein [Isosphaeraceae bacterium]